MFGLTRFRPHGRNDNGSALDALKPKLNKNTSALSNLVPEEKKPEVFDRRKEIRAKEAAEAAKKAGVDSNDKEEKQQSTVTDPTSRFGSLIGGKPAVDVNKGGEEKEKKKKQATSGRIRFTDVFEEEEEPIHETCEECEKVDAVIYCSMCKQLFCITCCDRCHRRRVESELHPHEVVDILGRCAMRPINKSDKSRVKLETPFHLPEYEYLDIFYETDLTKPNSLALNKSYNPTPSVAEYDLPMYTAGDRLLFIDPVTKEEAYGRIVCEWDFRHSAAAPPVLRGDHSGVWYIVEMLDLVKNVGQIEDFIQKALEKPPPIEYPKLDVEEVDNRFQYLLSLAIDEQLAILDGIKKHGPQRHLKNENLKLETLNERRLRIAQEKRKQQEMAKGPQKNKGANASTSLISEEAEAMKKALQDALDYAALPKSPRDASKRRLYHAIGVREASDGSIDKDDIDMHRALRFLALSEADVCWPEERSRLLIRQKRNRIKGIIEGVCAKNDREEIMRAWHIWKDKMEFLRERKQHLAAQKIQSIIRMFVKRHVIRDMKQAIIDDLREKWLKVQAPFHFVTKDTPGAKSMDGVLYFETVTHANRYAAALRTQCMKVFKKIDNKRLELLRLHLRKWRSACVAFVEADLTNGHFQQYAIDVDDATQNLTIDQQQEMARQAHLKLLKGGLEAVGTDLNQYENILNMPMLLKRLPPPPKESITSASEVNATNTSTAGELTNTSTAAGAAPRRGKTKRNFFQKVVEEVKEEYLDNKIPPWHPSIGVKLPLLPVIFTPKTAEERLHATKEKRLDYAGFRGKSVGPTDESFWVIPELLCAGPLPHGMSSKLSKLTAVAGIITSGINTFISLMEEDEEIECEKLLGIQSLPHYFKGVANKAKFTLLQQIAEHERVIEKSLLDIQKIHDMGLVKTDRKWQDSRDELKRLNARIKMSESAIAKVRIDVQKLPMTQEHLRIPLKPNSAPTQQEILPTLWELERRIAEGGNYLYTAVTVMEG